MESIIKWKKGVPKEAGRYIATNNNGYVISTGFHPNDMIDRLFFESYIIAWCKLSEIKPYKEEEV